MGLVKRLHWTLSLAGIHALGFKLVCGSRGVSAVAIEIAQGPHPNALSSLLTRIKDYAHRCHILISTNTSFLEKGPVDGHLSDCFYDAFEAKGVSH